MPLHDFEEQLRSLRSQSNLPTPLDDSGSLDQPAVEYILQTPLQKDSFEMLEFENHKLAPGVFWQRNRVAWNDATDGSAKGFCINVVRLERHAAAHIRPDCAFAQPGMVDMEAVDNAYWQTVWASGAIRAARGTKHPRLFLNTRELTCARDGAPRGPWEDLHELQRKVEAGTWNNDLLDLVPTLKPHFVDAPEGDLRVARYLPAYPPSAAVQADPDVLVATNSGFFLNFPEEYEDGVSALHQPVGALYADGHLHIPSWITRPCALEWEDGVRGIELLGPENLTLQIEDYPAFNLTLGTRSPSALATVWRSFDGPIPPSEDPGDAVDLVFSGAGLVRISYPGTETPPLGGAIVRLRGAVANPWKIFLTDPKSPRFPQYKLRLRTSRDRELAFVMAAGPSLLHDGHLLTEELMFSPLAAGEFRPNGPAPTRFPYDATKSRAPRTALGLTTREEWVLVVVDGRSDPAHSVGCTLEELARLMQRLGCYRAMNFDGGGSSVMAIEGLRPIDQLKPGLTSTVANIPSDTGNRERIVPVCITVVRKKL
ncbi:MAG: phosphodiester glycosidase family protein [Candidatus Sumerlaeia bacterium]|nr:phosphodiester glycosidase family protein [Candidatus Sumerlaeia bacterium]